MDIRSNEPFWLVNNGILNAYPSLRKDMVCDVLIVGAGITGALMAHACVGAGFHTVVIDKREVANGSTSATTSMLQYEIDVPLYELEKLIGEVGAIASYKACRNAIDRLGRIAEDIKSDAGFTKKDSLYFANTTKDVKWLKQEFEKRLKAGFEVQWLDAKQIQADYDLKAEGGILSKDGASVDAFRLAHQLLNYNQKRKLEIYDKTALKKVKYLKDEVLIETNTEAKIRAKKIIYCTGYESTQVIPEKIVKLKSTYAMVSERMDQIPSSLNNTLFWNTDNPYLYMRTTADGRLLVGGEDENFKNATLRDALLNKKEEKLTKAIHKLMPKTEFITDFVWCGTFGETKDGLPYIGPHPKFPNTYFCLGFGGNGITFSVIGADMIVGMLQNEIDPFAYFFRFGR
ncbi:NAD(P)/FAD-dependent oxidoreductase [Pedobacter xixiisoli]|uniref:Glycine/D-amino acid oxidase n=1 Tax=Pedobacter xixiisoli TaxID=1476464 RepID=A0A286ADU2_9SPHI|nr:FAD-binding oxidoreductase [Pedobacter xixiisoli]SOD20065.1 Glycine/D-amino acid oxidase [Pedobacter xixiisoli]